MNKEKVSILILNWNRKDETARAIESALDQSYQNIEIILIDNGSTDGSEEYIATKYPKITFIKLDKNYGCPGGRNRGVQYCSGDFIFYLDNDGVLHQNAVENAIDCIIKDNKIAVVTGLVKDFTEESEIDTAFSLEPLACKEAALFQGGISMHRKSVYNNVGLYPDDYFYGGEETFLSYKIIDAGFKIHKSDQVVLWHKKSKLARNNSQETIRKWNNQLMNAYQLFPFEYFILFFIYFVFRYPIYALRHSFLHEYFDNLLPTIRRLSNYERNPVKRSIFKKIRKRNF